MKCSHLKRNFDSVITLRSYYASHCPPILFIDCKLNQSHQVPQHIRRVESLKKLHRFTSKITKGYFMFALNLLDVILWRRPQFLSEMFSRIPWKSGFIAHLRKGFATPTLAINTALNVLARAKIWFLCAISITSLNTWIIFLNPLFSSDKHPFGNEICQKITYISKQLSEMTLNYQVIVERYPFLHGLVGGSVPNVKVYLYLTKKTN